MLSALLYLSLMEVDYTPRAGGQAAERCEATGVDILLSDHSLLLLPLLFSTTIPLLRSFSRFLLCFTLTSPYL